MRKVKIEVEIPLSLYDELYQIAEASSWSFDEVILQSIRTGMPPSLSKIPEAFHDALIALNRLGDRDLLRVVEGELLAKEKSAAHKKADFKLLRRTYALRLLKWRGHPIPSPYEAIVE